MKKLKKITSDRFIIDLLYRTTNNAFYRDMYGEFGIDAAYVHPDLHERLIRLEEPLRAAKLKLVVYDTFRPWVVQKFMYESAPEFMRDTYIAAPPSDGDKDGYHVRGAAIDCYLANEDGTPLEFQTTPDAFYVGWEKDLDKSMKYFQLAERKNTNQFSAEVQNNQRLLDKFMVDIAGLYPLQEEWWHYELPEAWKYPVIKSLDDAEVE